MATTMVENTHDIRSNGNGNSNTNMYISGDNDNDNDEETRRVEKLETELGSMRQAFEEFIATTQDLEIDLDKELHDMRTYCASSFGL